MPRFLVEVIIRNKRVARDPEGETIERELVTRSSVKDKIMSVRSGKWYLIEVEANDLEEALEVARRLSSETRMFNPIIHEMEVRPYQGGSA